MVKKEEQAAPEVVCEVELHAAEERAAVEAKKKADLAARREQTAAEIARESVAAANKGRVAAERKARELDFKLRNLRAKLDEAAPERRRLAERVRELEKIISPLKEENKKLRKTADGLDRQCRQIRDDAFARFTENGTLVSRLREEIAEIKAVNAGMKAAGEKGK